MRPLIRQADTVLNVAGEAITGWVGTMWCALLFAGIAFFGLPEAIQTNEFVPWLAQSFLQLVLLSVIMVGQSNQAARQYALLQETHDTVMNGIRDVKAIVAAVHAEVSGG